jgi:hypothetical protein
MKVPSERDMADRDQLWASLRTLRSDIELLTVAEAQLTEREQQVVRILSRIVLAELDFRARHAEPD